MFEGHNRRCSGLTPDLLSGNTPRDVQGRVLGIEPRLTICKACSYSQVGQE